MDVNIKGNSKEDLISELLASGALTISPLPMSGIDPSKFLREDLSLNLELLELAVEYITQSEVSRIYLYNMDWYYRVRGIITDSLRKKTELAFLVGFCEAVANEFSEYGDIKVIPYDEAV